MQEKAIKSLHKMRNRIAADPEGIKFRFHKVFTQSSVSKSALIETIFETGITPIGWKESRTVLVPKTNKAKVNEFRPIVLNSTRYKVMTSVIRRREELNEGNEMGEDNRADFTEGND